MKLIGVLKWQISW